MAAAFPAHGVVCEDDHSFFNDDEVLYLIKVRRFLEIVSKSATVINGHILHFASRDATIKPLRPSGLAIVPRVDE